MIKEFYRNKTVTLTGSNGFLGKAVLEKLLFEIPEIKKINLFLRINSGETIEDKFKSSILDTPIFNRLRDKYKTMPDTFENWIGTKIRLYAVNYQNPNLSLQPAEITELFSDENIFMHIAASVNWDDPMDYTINNNLVSTINLAELIKNNQVEKSHLVYISSALIFGKVNGACFEKPLGTGGTADEHFNSKNEQLKKISVEHWIEIARKKREEFTAAANTKIKNPCPYECVIYPQESMFQQLLEKMRRDWVDKQLAAFGKKIAKSYQYNDMYTFSKALGEIHLEEYKNVLHLSVVRSSAITASINHPYAGWIERMISYNPLIYKIGQGKLKIMPAKRDALLDFIPLDLVVNQICLAPLHTILPSKQYIFNSANSDFTEHRAKDVVRWIECYFINNPMKEAFKNKKSGYVKLILPPALVLSLLELQLNVVVGMIQLLFVFQKIPLFIESQKKLVFHRKNILKNIRMLNLYRVYLEGGNWTIKANTTEDYWNRLTAEEQFSFNVDIKRATNWNNYWEQIHIPGMMKFMIRN
jgi:fatty acyl-CoA reductase